MENEPKTGGEHAIEEWMKEVLQDEEERYRKHLARLAIKEVNDE